VSPGGLRNFSNLGIAVQRDGSLTFDSSKLASALASSPANVSALLTTSGTSSNGLALRAANTLDGIIASTGILASRSDGINRTIAGIGKQRDRLSQHLVDVEARYRKQYSALDTLVAGFQQTSQYLTQQLANLPKTSG
jgi:flagellar hook-associated protein 2